MPEVCRSTEVGRLHKQVHLNKLECPGKVYFSNSTQIVKLVFNKFNANRLQ